MMYTKRRTIPLGVSVWMDKDVKVRKVTASSGLMPDQTRVSVFLSRQFYADMLDLSSERYRQIARFDYNRKIFLKKQKHKADTNMPGLLPYIEPFKEEFKKQPTFSRTNQFHSLSSQSIMNSSLIKSDATYPPRKRTVKKYRSNNISQISLERINQLAQPKGQHIRFSLNDHLQALSMKSVPSDELFHNIDELSYDSFTSKDQQSSINDRRFQKLIHLFSNVYEPEPLNIYKLQQEQESKHNSILPSIDYKGQQDISNDSYLINV